MAELPSLLPIFLKHFCQDGDRAFRGVESGIAEVGDKAIDHVGGLAGSDGLLPNEPSEKAVNDAESHQSCGFGSGRLGHGESPLPHD